MLNWVHLSLWKDHLYIRTLRLTNITVKAEKLPILPLIYKAHLFYCKDEISDRQEHASGPIARPQTHLFQLFSLLCLVFEFFFVMLNVRIFLCYVKFFVLHREHCCLCLCEIRELEKIRTPPVKLRLIASPQKRGRLWENQVFEDFSASSVLTPVQTDRTPWYKPRAFLV